MCEVLMPPNHKALLVKDKALPMTNGAAYHQAMLSTSLELAKRLREAFAKTGMTQAAFARACHQSPQTVSSWLKTGRIDKAKLLTFAKAAGVSIDDLLGQPQDHIYACNQNTAPPRVEEPQAHYFGQPQWPFQSFTAQEFLALPAELRSSAEGYIQGLITASHVKRNGTTGTA